MSKNDQAVYLMVPRKLVITWIVINITLFALIFGNTYFTLWTARQWCGIVQLFNSTYTKEPPTTDAGKILHQEFIELANSYRCQKGL